MTTIVAHLLRLAFWAALLPLAALAACGGPQPPMSLASQPVPAASTLGHWPAPAAPFDTTPIGPAESAGAAAND